MPRTNGPSPHVGLFRPIAGAQTALLSDLATSQIMGLIRSGQLPVGSQLPSERALSERLGVSRTVLRESLRVLEASGVLRARVGLGRFLSKAPGEARASNTKVQEWLQLHYAEVADVNYLQQLLSPAAMLDMPIHLLQSVAAEARDITKRMRAAVEAEDFVSAAKLDPEFHSCLSRHATNRLLRELVLALIEVEAETVKATYALPEVARRSLEQHEAIVSALERGSREDASQQLLRHKAEGLRLIAEKTTVPPAPPPR